MRRSPAGRPLPSEAKEGETITLNRGWASRLGATEKRWRYHPMSGRESTSKVDRHLNGRNRVPGSMSGPAFVNVTRAGTRLNEYVAGGENVT
jgi:hypothetical protein